MQNTTEAFEHLRPVLRGSGAGRYGLGIRDGKVRFRGTTRNLGIHVELFGNLDFRSGA